MCEDCGCGVNPHREGHAELVDVLTPLMDENRRMAAHNREHFDAHGVLAVNLMSSPGAGKTALIEATIDRLGEGCRIAVVEGDLETENDAARVRAKGVEAVQICTSTTCHLDAAMVHYALHRIDLDAIDLLIIENVGNLVCPAGFDLGQHENVVLLSVTEGDDKPAKYPVMFRAADLVLLSKADLLEVLDDFDPVRAEASLRQLGVETPLFPVAARRTPVLDGWLDWLQGRQAERRARVSAGAA